MILHGPPNTIQKAFLPTKKGGYWVKIKYNSDGRAVLIRHETVHTPNGKHSNPHNHVIDWIPPNFYPQKGEQINYFDGDIPGFKNWLGNGEYMMLPQYDPEIYRFKTISEFKMSMHQGSEVVFEWNGKEYFIWAEVNRGRICITSADNAALNQVFHTADEALEFMIRHDRLRDIITRVTVVDRTI